jgi:hypothetical protein
MHKFNSVILATFYTAAYDVHNSVLHAAANLESLPSTSGST